jgi:hypothetical protein
MLVLVAIIALIGTIAASNLVNDWFKRRDLRESIRADLEVYQKLPDSDTKSSLLEDIENRVRDMTTRKPASEPVLGVVAAMAFALWSFIWALMFVEGSLRFTRNHDTGMLRVHIRDAGSFDFGVWVLSAILLWLIVSVFTTLAITYVDPLITRRLKRQR